MDLTALLSVCLLLLTNLTALLAAIFFYRKWRQGQRLAVLSEQHQPLFNYFKQMFAQVTNPPIDAIREKIVTDTAVHLGCSGNLLVEGPENCKMLCVTCNIQKSNNQAAEIRLKAYLDALTTH